MRYPLLACTKGLTLIKGISHFSPFSSIQLGIFSAGRLTNGQAQWVAIVWILLWFGGETQKGRWRVCERAREWEMRSASKSYIIHLSPYWIRHDWDLVGISKSRLWYSIHMLTAVKVQQTIGFALHWVSIYLYWMLKSSMWSPSSAETLTTSFRFLLIFPYSKPIFLWEVEGVTLAIYIDLIRFLQIMSTKIYCWEDDVAKCHTVGDWG